MKSTFEPMLTNLPIALLLRCCVFLQKVSPAQPFYFVQNCRCSLAAVFVGELFVSQGEHVQGLLSWPQAYHQHYSHFLQVLYPEQLLKCLKNL